MPIQIDAGEFIEQLRRAIDELTSDNAEYTSADILAIFDRAACKALYRGVTQQAASAGQANRKPGGSRKPRQRRALGPVTSALAPQRDNGPLAEKVVGADAGGGE